MMADEVRKLNLAAEDMWHLLNRVFEEGAFKVPTMTVPAAYAFMTVSLHRMAEMTFNDEFYVKADRLFAFLHLNMPTEIVLMAIKTGTRIHQLPFNSAKMPAYAQIIQGYGDFDLS